MTHSNKILLLLAIATILCLAGRILENTTLDYSSKPFLMPLLYLYFRLSTSEKSLRHVVPIALFFAWLGDMFLMIAHGTLSLFIAGLLGFLVMQLLYLKMYKVYSLPHATIFKSKPYLAIPSILLGLGFYCILFPNLQPVLKIAVALYALALVSMTLGAINRLDYCDKISFYLVTIGAFSFMFSDMMIGYNNFLTSFPMAGFWIMLTYIGGQFLIIQGVIQQSTLIINTKKEEHS